MLIRLMRELGRLLLKVWAEQAVCASGRGLAQDGVRHGHALPSGRRNAVAG